VFASACLPAVSAAAAAPRPNVVVILADDLGFTDLACYGGEIETPHLDRLASRGLRFTQAYNTSRCWPSRAALLTGYYPQAIRRDSLPGGGGGKDGRRPPWARLLPELLAAAGYRSYHSGKWHVDGTPAEGGFACSLLVNFAGQNNYFDPRGIEGDADPVAGASDFYITSVIGDHAVACLARHARDHAGTPFFHYVAFTAPHFPLHAPPGLIEKYRDRYVPGRDAAWQARCAAANRLGIVTAPVASAPPAVRAAKAGAEIRMALHAAMVESLDTEVGRIVSQLKRMDVLEDTLILFASDNGASAEQIVRGEGHDPHAAPGSRSSFLCLGPAWATCANAPFRGSKMGMHEGAIATPLIAHWPARITDAGGLRHAMIHLVDVAPTVLALAGVDPQARMGVRPMPEMHGHDFSRCFADRSHSVHQALWWCHAGNRALRAGDWKMVAPRGGTPELYYLASDRCETRDLAMTDPDRLARLEAEWARIAEECRTMAANDAGLPMPPAAPAAASRTIPGD